MHSRQDVVEIFSTFLQLEAGVVGRWSSEPRLKRSMVKILQKLEQRASKAVCARYWYEQYRLQADARRVSNQPIDPTADSTRAADVQLAPQHLLALVQESCYWAVYRFHQKVAQFSAVSHYTLADYFQIAQSQFPRLLMGFDAERGASLETYAELAFSNRLRDAVRQQKVMDVCSDWSLLRRVSRKRLSETLAQQSLSPHLSQSYLLAWICFQEVWVPGVFGRSQRQAEPEADDWLAISQAYNQAKTPEHVTASPAQLEAWLKQAAHWLRTYLYPQLQSLNQMQYGQTPLGETGEERLERLADPAGEAQIEGLEGGDASLLTHLMVQEEETAREAVRSQLQQILQQSLETLKPDWQTALDLYYRQGLIQSQIAKRIGCSQPSVARYLLRSREALLGALVTWSQQTLNIQPDPDRIRRQGEVLDEWLRLHYGDERRER